MDSELYDGERARWRANLNTVRPDPGFENIWPTETRGNGVVRKNNLITGAAQGKGSLIRKAPCRLCGFPNDLTAIDHSGGSIDGEGAGGQITTSTVSFPVSAPQDVVGQITTSTENIGTQSLRRGAGCALCFSKNSTKQRVLLDVDPSPWDKIQPLGF